MPKTLSVKELSERLGAHAMSQGWTGDEELREYGTSIDGSSIILVHKALLALDKAGFLTRKAGPDGRTPGWAVVMAAQRSQGATYGGYSPDRIVTMRLRTDTIGSLSEDGQSFVFERDDEGQIIFNNAQFKAMLEKAHMLAPVPVDEGKEPPSRESVRRWRVHFQRVVFPDGLRDGALPTRIRRPINIKGASVGELHHEALPPGTLIEWLVSWPSSHWTDAQAILLLDAAQDIGFSPAGNGKYGGLRGLFRLVPAEVEPSTNGKIEDDDLIALAR